uniref:Uncharacterized protein n=1 Tax=Rhizophora mucronata TaxID=61149 RepID=A0A2P2QJH2_RHIMU
MYKSYRTQCLLFTFCFI